MLTIISVSMMVAMGFIAMFLCKLWMNTRKLVNRARCAAAGSAFLLLAVPLATQASVVFQADFNGSSGTTGQSNSIVTLGGTATLVNGSNFTATIGTASPLFTGEPGYLHLTDTGTGSGGVSLRPASTASSLDSWFVLQSGTQTFNQLNGAIDFFFRDSIGSSGWTGTGSDFRPLDLSGGNGGMRLILNAPSTNMLQVELVIKNSAGTVVQDLRAVCNSPNVEANALYHMALATNTHPTTGIVTLKMYLAKGNTPIDTASSATLIASATSTAAITNTGTNAINHAFNSFNGFTFGQNYSAADVKTLDFGCIRFYNAFPSVMNAVTYLPDLPNVAKPNPEPTLPTAFDLYSPHVIAGGTAAASTPIGAEWTRTGNPTDALVVAGDLLSSYTGADEAKDSAYLCYGQNASVIQSAQSAIERQVGDRAAIRLDQNLPSSAMYLIWPRNANGYGVPMVVNQTEAWWIGPDKVTRGDTTSLYGRNLSYSISGTAASNAWIYIKPQGSGTGQWVTPSAVNPYKVDFTVPTGLTNGTYEIWGHNGHGGHYGWSGPVLLTVNDGTPWTATQFNVKNAPFNAKGDGVTDDTTAIRNAVTASGTSAYSTVYFPAGTYMVSSGFTPPSNTRWLGAGATSSMIKWTAGNRGWGVMANIRPGVSNVTISNLSLDAGASIYSYLVNSYNGQPGGPSGFKITDCILTATNGLTTGSNCNQGMLYFYPIDHLTLKNVVFNGGICLIDATQVFIDGCTFNGTWDGSLLDIKGNSSSMSYTNNIGQDYNYAIGRTYDPATSTYVGDTFCTGWSQAVFFKGNLSNSGCRLGTYFGNNVSNNMGVRLYNPDGSSRTDVNWGEQISFEAGFGQYYGTPTAATGTSVTFAPSTMSGTGAVTVTGGTLSTTAPMIATIFNGTGVGQWRPVSSINTTTGVVTLAGKPWNVLPDSTSSVVLGYFTGNVVSYQNHFDGKHDRVGSAGQWGITGFLPYGGIFNAVCDSNLYTYNMYGINSCSFVPCDGTAMTIQPNYFHLYLNNVMQDCQQVIGQAMCTSFSYTNYMPLASSLGLVYRNNTSSDTVAGTTQSAIKLISQPVGVSDTMDFCVFDKNSITDTVGGVNLINWNGYSMTTQGNLLFLHNTFNRGSALSGSSFGVYSPGGVKVGLGGNSYTDFASTYTGTPPGALMEAPYRVLETSASRAKGVSATATVTVWNGGSSSVGWSATDDQTWLTVSPASGTVADENSVSTFTVTCAPGTLTDGTYTGTVTLTCGTQTKKVQVLFTVNP